MSDRISDWVSVTGRTGSAPLEDEPQNVRLEKPAANSFKVLWDKSELADEDEYEVRYKAAGNDFEGSVMTKDQDYTFADLDFETDYTFEVRSIKKA